MKQSNTKSYSDHQELYQLLPWYANKTLQGAELKAVEDHLAVCLVCKRELIQIQKLAQAVLHSGSIDSAEQASFSRLKKRLHSGSSAALQPNPGHGSTQQHNAGNIKPFSRTPRKQVWANNALMRPALAMAATVLLALSILMPRYTGNEMQQFDSNFRTLSSDKNTEAMNTNEIRVVFAEKINQQLKNEILGRVHGQLVGDKPTAQGVYTVRLERDISSDHLLDAIDLLRKDRNVVFAEPAYAALSSTQVEK